VPKSVSMCEYALGRIPRLSRLSEFVSPASGALFSGCPVESGSRREAGPQRGESICTTRTPTRWSRYDQRADAQTSGRRFRCRWLSIADCELLYSLNEHVLMNQSANPRYTGPLFRRSTIPKVHYSESLLCRYAPQC